MSVTCLFQYTGIRIFNDHTCERRIICSTRSVYIFLEKKTPFSPNIIFYYITAPRLNKKYVAPGHQNLAGEFCVVGGEFSDLQCLMNTLQEPRAIGTKFYGGEKTVCSRQPFATMTKYFLLTCLLFASVSFFFNFISSLLIL